MNKDLSYVKQYIENTKGFIDKKMAEIYHSQDMEFINGILKASVRFGFKFDEERIKHWLEFCNKMNNIDKTDIENIAISNKFAELNKKIDMLERENRELKYKLEDLEDY